MYIIKLLGKLAQNKWVSELHIGPTKTHADCERWLLKNGFVPCDEGNSCWKRKKKGRVLECECTSSPLNLQAKVLTLQDLSVVRVKN